VTAQWARVACQGTDNAFEMSTFNDIEMLDENGESFLIAISEEFSAWNVEIAKKGSSEPLYRWGSIVEMLEKLWLDSRPISIKIKEQTTHSPKGDSEMQINHTEYPKSLKRKTVSQLLFIIKDCREALEAMPSSPKAGYYADEIAYCSMELSARGIWAKG
jgi:hypothetical protein